MDSTTYLTATATPALLSRINERQVLRTLQTRGPLSRAELARHSGMSAPTASKAVDTLLRAGLLEEGEAPEAARGRPAKRLHLASKNVQVLGFVIDADECRMVAAGLDAQLHDERIIAFRTPKSYTELLDRAEAGAHELMNQPGLTTLGLGVSMPGLFDTRNQRGVLSPNVPLTNGHSPCADLSARLGVECVSVQEATALCLAERWYGAARGLNDFAMLDVTTGVGLGVMSGGRPLEGHSGLAGEVGHITVQADGRLCGCGNQGCLETVASDSALAWMAGQRLGRKTHIDELIELSRAGKLSLAVELETIARYLGIGLAAIINMFNPSTLFVHGKLFTVDDSLFSKVVEEARRRSLPPSFADCQIIQARGSKRQGAVVAIIEHLTNTFAPALLTES